MSAKEIVKLIAERDAALATVAELQSERGLCMATHEAQNAEIKRLRAENAELRERLSIASGALGGVWALDDALLAVIRETIDKCEADAGPEALFDHYADGKRQLANELLPALRKALETE